MNAKSVAHLNSNLATEMKLNEPRRSKLHRQEPLPVAERGGTPSQYNVHNYIHIHCFQATESDNLWQLCTLNRLDGGP